MIYVPFLNKTKTHVGKYSINIQVEKLAVLAVDQAPKLCCKAGDWMIEGR